MLRVTWVQPEDLIGHELRQAAEDGRDPEPARRAWLAAGGHLAPERAGASPGPADPALRALAARLLDELAALPSPSAVDEPQTWEAVRASWPAHDGHAAPVPDAHPAPGPDGHAAPRAAGPGAPRPPVPPDLRDRLEAAWLGRAAGCLLGKPVEKLPLHAVRALARAAGNWPLDGWFTAEGVPPELLAAHPWNRRSAPTSLAENIDGMPEDDDLNYPLLGLLLLQRHGPG
ncbi:ADP-ribosylglycohydrolase family protein, partial [Streptomyces xanthophaeus]